MYGRLLAGAEGYDVVLQYQTRMPFAILALEPRFRHPGRIVHHPAQGQPARDGVAPEGPAIAMASRTAAGPGLSIWPRSPSSAGDNLAAVARIMSYATPLEARLAKKVTRAIIDYHLIEDGDRVMVGLSGGKDSWALIQILDVLRKRAPISFSIVAVNVNSGYERFRHDL